MVYNIKPKEKSTKLLEFRKVLNVLFTKFILFFSLFHFTSNIYYIEKYMFKIHNSPHILNPISIQHF